MKKLLNPKQEKVENKDYFPLVSIVVPNYNHSKFLKRRLDSIYNQSYKNYEVILLDDASTDDSVKILQKYQEKYSDVTRLIINKKNSGGVFYQWKKAFDVARGELLWIAESDDFADNNFLEVLAPYFKDEAINLAYCNPSYINAISDRLGRVSLYISGIGKKNERKSFINTAAKEVEQALSIQNTIPNVSCALMRKIPLNILEDKNWVKMRLCGDWILYLELIKGGKLACSTSTKSYYRRHAYSTSSKIKNDLLYIHEHQKVAEYIALNYGFSAEAINQFLTLLKNRWCIDNPEYKTKDFAYLDLEKIRHLSSQRKPNILIGIDNIQFEANELSPFRLANELKECGYTVTVFNDFNKKKDDKTRQFLQTGIPIIYSSNYKSVNEIIDDHKINIINTHSCAVDQLFMRELVHAQAKFIITCHNCYEIKYKPTKKSLNELKKLFSKVDNFVYWDNKVLLPLKLMGVYDKKKFIKIDSKKINFHGVVDKYEALFKTYCSVIDIADLIKGGGILKKSFY